MDAEVTITPWATLEADCLALMLAEGGLIATGQVTERTRVCLVAPARNAGGPALAGATCGPQQPPTLLIVPRVDADTVSLSRAVGASGLLTWSSDAAAVTSAVLAAIEGRSAGPGKIARQEADPCEDMTDRELDVLGLVVLGQRDQEIAERLGISSNTVRTHLQHVMMKLDVTHRQAAAARARSSAMLRARLDRTDRHLRAGTLP